MIYLSLLQAEFPVLLFSIVMLFGLLIGSFLNVIIYRLPVMMQREWEIQAKEILNDSYTAEDTQPFNLAVPNSQCPQCQHKIKPWENIPLLSFVFLKGKCSACGADISIRYPIVELSTGILTAVVVSYFGPNLAGLAACIFTWALICLTLIDFDHTLLPDDITLPMMWLGMVCNYFGLITSFANAFWGAVMGYLAFWSVSKLFRIIMKKDGMGFGDFKMLAMLGAWLGWQMLPLIIILSSLAGAIIGGLLIAAGRDRSNPIPFGPFLAIAGWITLIWGVFITRAYLDFAAF